MSAEWLDDAFGPDGVRVTNCVERAVDRLVRERNAWGFGQHLLFRRAHEAVQQAVFSAVQSAVLNGRYAVLIESDSGERLRITRPSHEEAVDFAKACWHDITAEGVPALERIKRGG